MCSSGGGKWRRGSQTLQAAIMAANVFAGCLLWLPVNAAYKASARGLASSQFFGVGLLIHKASPVSESTSKSNKAFTNTLSLSIGSTLQQSSKRLCNLTAKPLIVACSLWWNDGNWECVLKALPRRDPSCCFLAAQNMHLCIDLCIYALIHVC